MLCECRPKRSRVDRNVHQSMNTFASHGSDIRPRLVFFVRGRGLLLAFRSQGSVQTLTSKRWQSF